MCAKTGNLGFASFLQRVKAALEVYSRIYYMTFDQECWITNLPKTKCFKTWKGELTIAAIELELYKGFCRGCWVVCICMEQMPLHKYHISLVRPPDPKTWLITVLFKSSIDVPTQSVLECFCHKSSTGVKNAIGCSWIFPQRRTHNERKTFGFVSRHSSIYITVAYIFHLYAVRRPVLFVF